MVHEEQSDRTAIHELDISIRTPYNRARKKEARVYPRLFLFIPAQEGGMP